MHNNRETVIIPQTLIVPTKSIIVASLLAVLVKYRKGTILSKLNRGLFANCCYTIHDGLNVLKHIICTHTCTHTHTHTHARTHTYTGALRLEENLSLPLFCYLVTLPEVDHSRDFIFTAYRSIHQFPATIEICLVYLLSS